MKRADITPGKKYLIDRGAYYVDEVGVVEEIEKHVRQRFSFSTPTTVYAVRVRFLDRRYTTTVPLSQVKREWTDEDEQFKQRQREHNAAQSRAASEARDRLNTALAAAGLERITATGTKHGDLTLSTLRVEDAHRLAGHLESWAAAHAAAVAIPRDGS